MKLPLVLLFFIAYTATSQSWSPDGSKIIYVTDRHGINEIYEIDLNDKNKRRLTHNTFSELHPSYSSDGNKILFDSDIYGNRDLFILDLENDSLTRLTHHEAPDLVGVFGLDDHIYFNSLRDGNFEIYSLNLATGEKKNLTNNASKDIMRSLTWDKKEILFDSDRNGSRAIFKMYLDGSDVQQITFPDSIIAHRIAMPAPNGNVAYSAKKKGEKEQIEVINSAGIRSIFIDTPGNEFYPHWSADGDLIAFISDVNGARDIYLADKEGNILKQLTRNAMVNFPR